MATTDKYKEHEEIYQKFKDMVNMAPAEIEDHLETEDSQRVGQDSGDGTSIGVKSAHRIIEIKRKRKADLTEDDYSHMQKVISYISRHTAQGPEKKADEKDSPWRYSLMNWGHDPLK